MDINKKLADFKAKLKGLALSSSEAQHYVDIAQYLLEREQLPSKELLARAKRIKPLIRLTFSSISGYHKKQGAFLETDMLCFCKPCEIKDRSYLFDFTSKRIVMCKGRPFTVPKRRKIGEFACYHSADLSHKYAMPCIDEVLRQIPAEIDWHTVDAFELSFSSAKAGEVYDSVLDRHVSTVILYHFENGLPSPIKNQDIIYEGYRYEVARRNLFA